MDALLNLLYNDVVYDAVMLGFSMVDHDAKIDFGSEAERADHASKIVAALGRRIPMGLEHVYVPLILAGTILAPRLTIANENPWHSLASLKEARDGRNSLAGTCFRRFSIFSTG